MKFLKYIFIVVLLFRPIVGWAQDSVKTLSLEEVTNIVKLYHPVARQANILIGKAKADVTISRGMFDPVLMNESAQKTFDGTNYYNYNRPELSIPTWFGIEVKAGLEYLAGSRTSPEETIGESSYLGISIPLAKNLLMDKRRAALQTAKIFRTASAVEKKNILNNLMLEAAESYWDWVQQYQRFIILNNTVAVNEQRVKLVRTAFAIGERPAIDTTEAISQLQAFELLKSEAWLEFQNAGLNLSLFMWNSLDTPVDLPEDVIPADDLQSMDVNTVSIPSVDSLLNAAIVNHPELLIYNYKLDVLSIEKKLKFQELLPVVNFSYNQLGSGYDILKTATGPLFENNFQYGLKLGIPLRLSQGRGEYKKAKFKIEETKLQLNYKRQLILNKVKSYYNELLALQYQVNLQQLAYNNYATLQRGEEIRFRAGESSLFLVNSRETKALEALQKLQEKKAKYYISIIKLQWAAGMLMP